MSIATLTLQILTIKALAGATLAGDIISEPVDPLSDDYQMSPTPVIAVFTGSDDRPSIEGRDLLGADRSVELSIQIYCPAKVTVTVDGSPVQVSMRGGGGGDLIVGMIGRQIERALLASDSAAAVLWRTMVNKIKSVSSSPYLFELKKGVRIVAQETVFVLDTVSDPSFGIEPDEAAFWGQALALISADADYAPLASWIRSEIEAPDGMPVGRSAQADVGLGEAAARFLSIRPLVDDGAAAGLFVVKGDGDPELSVDAALVEQALPDEDV